MLDYWIYLIPIAAIGYLIWSRRTASAGDIKAYIEKGAQFVDVRTRGEFRAQHHPKALNIPMDELEQGLKKLDKNRPVLLCCDSGSRSGFAVSLLKRAGFTEVANLGSWTRMNSLLP
jgi:rhodanese-related sulfurtransferase